MDVSGQLIDVRRAGSLTVGELFRVQCRKTPTATAVLHGKRALTYAALNQRVNQCAQVLAANGIARGDRLAVLSENRTEYLELAFAAAKLGAVLCALNWRLAQKELVHCIALVEPKVLVHSARYRDGIPAQACRIPSIDLDRDYPSLLAHSLSTEPADVAEPEDGLLILYTSGTTGLPKAAVISHRAELARLTISRVDLDLRQDDGYVAWSPMFHMVALEHAMQVLCIGGKVFVVDGADDTELVRLVTSEKLWWLPLMPGMIDTFLAAMTSSGLAPKGVKLVGGLADLLPPQTIAQMSSLLGASFWNTFGSTETGMMPVAGTFFAAGVAPTDLAKAHNACYDWRLVDDQGRDVQPGEPGEILVRGPAVFSGYWNAPEATAEALRGGWYHMGDLFIEQPDGRLNFIDRAKYLIKSGGENIYPIEIERVLMADQRVVEAVVVKRRDPTWGEVPVAFVVARDASVLADDLMDVCRNNLSRYKCPREIRFLASSNDFPRSTTGKVQRQLLETLFL